jgi:hypothetical protein
MTLVGKVVEVTLSRFIAQQKGIARIVSGEVIRETEKGILIRNVKMVPKPHVNCAWCGADLTNHVSRELGVGPICLGKYGERFNWASEAAERFDKLTDKEIKALIKKMSGAVMTKEEIWVPKRGGVEVIGTFKLEAPKLAAPVRVVKDKNAICW